MVRTNSIFFVSNCNRNVFRFLFLFSVMMIMDIFLLWVYPFHYAKLLAAFFFMKRCWVLHNSCCISSEMVVWYLTYTVLLYCMIFIELYRNTTWSPCLIFWGLGCLLSSILSPGSSSIRRCGPVWLGLALLE